MNSTIMLTPELKALAAKLGASYAAIGKWEQRGVSPKWEIRLLAELGLAPRIITKGPYRKVGRPAKIS